MKTKIRNLIIATISTSLLSGCALLNKKTSKIQDIEYSSVLKIENESVRQKNELLSNQQVCSLEDNCSPTNSGQVVEIIVPAITKQVSSRVIKTPAKTIERIIPATTKTVSRRVVKTPASTELRTNPAVLQTETRQVLKTPSRIEQIVGPSGVETVAIPATYETISEIVVVQSATTELVTIPATYKTVDETIVVQPENVETIVVVPAQYETVTETVVVQEASISYETTPETNSPRIENTLVALPSDENQLDQPVYDYWFYDFFEIDEIENNDSEKVIGGANAPVGMFPWHVAIKRKSDGAYKCGGTILDRSTIITAAHCFFKMKPTRQFYTAKNLTIGIGGGNKQKNNVSLTNMEFRDVREIIPHKKYKHTTTPGSNDPLPDYDLAILKLEIPIVFTDDIQPATLPKSDMTLELGDLLNLYGFGRHKSNDTDPSKYLQWGEVPFITNEICNVYQVYNGDVPKTHFCAGALERGAEACKGDSGGGLTLDDKSTLIGITSFGDPKCRLDGKPTVYTEVKQFLNWIKTHLEPEAKIRYYKKESDPQTILNTLHLISQNVDARPTKRLSNETTNAVWVGSKVNFAEFKYLITELIKKKVPIKRIAPSCSGKKQQTTNTIQIGTSPKALSDDIASIPLESIKSANSFEDIFTSSCGNIIN